MCSQATEGKTPTTVSFPLVAKLVLKPFLLVTTIDLACYPWAWRAPAASNRFHGCLAAPWGGWCFWDCWTFTDLCPVTFSSSSKPEGSNLVWSEDFSKSSLHLSGLKHYRGHSCSLLAWLTSQQSQWSGRCEGSDVNLSFLYTLPLQKWFSWGLLPLASGNGAGSAYLSCRWLRKEMSFHTIFLLLKVGEGC